MSERQIKEYYERIEKLLNGANKETYGFAPQEIKNILRSYEELQNQNKELKKQLEESKNIKNKLLVYNASIKGNWNKLKEFLKNTRKENLEWDKKHNCEWQGYNAYYELLIKMQELEQGSDSNELRFNNNGC